MKYKIILAITLFWATVFLTIALTHQPKKVESPKPWFPETNEPYMQDVTMEYHGKEGIVTIHAKELYIKHGVKNAKEEDRVQSEASR